MRAGNFSEDPNVVSTMWNPGTVGPTPMDCLRRAFAPGAGQPVRERRIMNSAVEAGRKGFDLQLLHPDSAEHAGIHGYVFHEDLRRI
jgi:hypothetical protein